MKIDFEIAKKINSFLAEKLLHTHTYLRHVDKNTENILVKFIPSFLN